MSQYFTSNVTNCTFTSWEYNFSLVQANNSYANAVALPSNLQLNYQVEGRMMTIKKLKRGIFDVFIMASASETRYGYKHMHFLVCGFENLIAISNETLNILYDNPVPDFVMKTNVS